MLRHQPGARRRRHDDRCVALQGRGTAARAVHHRPFGWHEHHHDLFEGTGRLFKPGYVANLVSAWIPALDGTEEKLRAGASVADVGCGYGASTILLAEHYPESTIVGFDFHADSVGVARKRAADAGVGERVRFEVASAQSYPGADYDLVCMFDSLHDMGDPPARRSTSGTA